MTRTVIALFLLILLAFGGWLLNRQPTDEAAPGWSVAEVKSGPIRDTVSATGTVNPTNTVLVGSQVSGTILELHADFNDQVKQGQVIARIDPATFEAKRAEAAANLRNAEAARDKAAIDIQDKKREYDRQADLLKKTLVAANVADAARFAWEAAKAELQVKMASIEQSRAALQLEQTNLDYTSIYAPIDGVVISRDVDVGQTVAASLQAPTLFTIAEDLTRMQVEADVDEAFIGKVQDGQPVSFTVFAYPNREFHGTVTQVRLQPKIEAGVVKYNCIIHVDNSDLALKPGMTATVSITTAQRDKVLTVPNGALRFVPDWPEEQLAPLRKDLQPGQSIVWRDNAGELVPVVVSTGIIGEKSTEVSGTELTAGERIAIPLKRGDSGRQRRFGLSLF